MEITEVQAKNMINPFTPNGSKFADFLGQKSEILTIFGVPVPYVSV